MLRTFRADAALRPDEMTLLAYAGALSSLGISRRTALWQVAEVSRPLGTLYENLPLSSSSQNSPLPEMSAVEETAADYRATDLTAGAASPRASAPGARRAVDPVGGGAPERARGRAREGRGRRHRAAAAGHREGLRLPVARGRERHRAGHRAPRPLQGAPGRHRGVGRPRRGGEAAEGRRQRLREGRAVLAAPGAAGSSRATTSAEARRVSPTPRSARPRAASRRPLPSARSSRAVSASTEPSPCSARRRPGSVSVPQPVSADGPRRRLRRANSGAAAS